jgi:gluconokinase
MQPYVLGIDIGTGSTKSVALNCSGVVIAVSQFYYPTIITSPGYSEHDPGVIWEAFVNCINKISAVAGTPLAIGLGSSMHSLIVMDGNHEALTNSITWADIRSEKIADELRRSGAAESLYRETGTPIHAMSPLCKIMWFKNNSPGIFTNASKFISIKEYIWHRLFNVYEADHSIASATGMFNITKFSWCNTSLNLCQITEAKLSELVPTDFIRKHLAPSPAALLNIPADTPFCIGASDGCLATIGSYATQPGIAALTIGTSGAVRLASPFPVFNFPTMTFNYVLDTKTFICGGPVNNGGSVIEWLFRTFIQNPNPDDTDFKNLFNTIETVAPACNGLLFLPYLYGERAPLWDEKSCGVYFGIRSYHTQAHFLRAAVEGVCYALLHVLQHIEASPGSINQLNVSGRVIQWETWLQILADITGKKIGITQTEDGSAIGAALLAMKAMNIVENYSSLKPAGERVLEPDFRNHEVYKKYNHLFKDLYISLKGLMHQVHDINN